MDIKAALLEEHSKAQCKKIVDYIGADRNKFDELMGVFFEGEYRVTQRAAWPLSYCIKDNPTLIQPYLGKLLDVLNQPGNHHAVSRNIIRLMQYIDIPKRFQGKIMTICFDFITSDSIPVAVKAFSLTVLDNLAKDYPEIASELKLIIEQRWNYETPAFRNRAKKILHRS